MNIHDWSNETKMKDRSYLDKRVRQFTVQDILYLTEIKDESMKLGNSALCYFLLSLVHNF